MFSPADILTAFPGLRDIIAGVRNDLPVSELKIDLHVF